MTLAARVRSYVAPTSHVRRVFTICPTCRQVVDEKLEFAHNAEPLTKLAERPCPTCLSKLMPRTVVVH